MSTIEVVDAFLGEVAGSMKCGKKEAAQLIRRINNERRGLVPQTTGRFRAASETASSDKGTLRGCDLGRTRLEFRPRRTGRIERVKDHALIARNRA